MNMISEIVISYLFGKLLDKFGETIVKQDFKERLTTVISKTIKDWESTYFSSSSYSSTTNYPFYKSEIFFKRLLGFVFFKEEIISIEDVLKELDNEQIIKPNREELESFFSNFQENIERDEKLKELFIAENYKERVFEILIKLNSLYSKIDSVNQQIESIERKISNPIQREWVKQIQEDIFNFKPRTALNHLNNLEKSLISDNILDIKTEAEISYLKGLCNYEMGLHIEGAEAYLKAYSKYPNKILYQEKALRVFTDRKEFEKAFKLIEGIFKQDSNNVTAWASKVFIEDGILEEKLRQVPSIIFDIPQNCQRFKSRLAGYYLTRNIEDLEVLDIIFSEELHKSLESPNKITLDNKYYWLLVSNLKVVKNTLNEHLLVERVNPAIKNSIDLKGAVKLMEDCLILMKDGEKSKSLFHYNFYLLFGKYSLSEKVADAIAIYNFYKELPSEEKINYQVLTIFALTQTKQFEAAIEIASDEDLAQPIALSAKAYAYHMLGFPKEAVRCSNKCFEKLEKIDMRALVNFITLQLIYTQDQFVREEQFLKFQDKFVGIAEKQIANLISRWHISSNEERKEQLFEIKNTIKDSGEEIHNEVV